MITEMYYVTVHKHLKKQNLHNNKHFNTYISDIYPPELELKETTESTTTVSYLDLLVDIDDFLTFKLFDKRDYLNFPIVNFPHLDNNIPVKPAYGVYVSLLISITGIPQKKYVNKHFLVIIIFRIHTIKHVILWSMKEYIIIL